MNDFIGDLVAEVQKVCRDKPDCNTLILGSERTKKFFDNRRSWGEEIRVQCELGELIKLDLPSFPLPVMSNTKERYFIGGVEIIPAYQYHSIAYFFLKRMGIDLFNYQRGGTEYQPVAGGRYRKHKQTETEEEE